MGPLIFLFFFFVYFLFFSGILFSLRGLFPLRRAEGKGKTLRVVLWVFERGQSFGGRAADGHQEEYGKMAGIDSDKARFLQPLMAIDFRWGACRARRAAEGREGACFGTRKRLSRIFGRAHKGLAGCGCRQEEAPPRGS